MNLKGNGNSVVTLNLFYTLSTLNFYRNKGKHSERELTDIQYLYSK